MECKAHGFSPASSNVNQGRKLLAYCADANSSLGSRGEATVIYVIPLPEAGLQLGTLSSIARELTVNRMPTANFGVLGLSVDENGLWAELSAPGANSNSPVGAICGRRLVSEDVGGSSRPIYIIPYDPAAADAQDPQERDYCKKLLAERVLTAAMHVLGVANAPSVVRLVSRDLLKEATFGVSSQWDAQELRGLEDRIASYIARCLSRETLRNKVQHYRSNANANVDVSLADYDDQRFAIMLLQKSRPSDLAQRLIDDQIGLAELHPDINI